MTKLKVEKSVVSDCAVRKRSTRSWSLMRWSRSPVCFVSKKLIGRRISLIRKSDSSEMFTRVLICSKIQRRMKSMAARLSTSISWPIRMR